MRLISLLLLCIVFLSCQNQYKQFGNAVDFKMHIQNLYKGEGETFQVNIEKDEFNISNRTIVIRLDTTIIYFGKYSKTIRVMIPNKFIGVTSIPNIYIVEPDSKKAYYFESKEYFEITKGDNLLTINLLKRPEFSDRVAFLSKHIDNKKNGSVSN
jgi:hypothetical protein